MGLENGVPYSATYHITGNGIDRNVTATGDSTVVSDLPLGTYTVEKTASVPDGYTAINTTGTKTAVVTGSVTFAPTVYTKQGVSKVKLNIWQKGTQNLLQQFEVDANSTITFNFTWNNGAGDHLTVNGQSYAVHWGQNSVQINIGSTDVDAYFSRWEVHSNNPVNMSVSPGRASSPSPIMGALAWNLPSAGSAATLENLADMDNATGTILRAMRLELVNTGANPPVSGFNWVEDANWSETVHLSNADGWSKTLEDLEQSDVNGSIYVYYIASASETGLPSGTVAVIDNDGTNKLVVYGNHGEGDNDTLTVTNTLPAKTSINIKKVDKNDTTQTLTGTKFELQKYTDAGYHEKDGPAIAVDASANGQVAVSNLTAGYYELVETQVPDGYVKISENPRFQIARDPQSGELAVVFANTSMVTYETESNTFLVRNEPGAELPMTGGPGGFALTMGGVLLVMTCSLLAAYRRVRLKGWR